MGRKVDPRSFRFFINNNYLSKWSCSKNVYSSLIKEDFYIRKYIEMIFKDLVLLSDINIERTSATNTTLASIYIQINFFIINEEDFLKKYNLNICQLNTNKSILFILNNFFNLKIKNYIKTKYNKNSNIEFNIISNPYSDPKLIAQIIGILINRRMPSKLIINQIFEKINPAEIKGLKIKLSGRLDGVEMAKSECKQYGNLPLNTINLPIDYALYSLTTIYGTIGIKVWIFKNIK
jgi:small subunit ribosomal protein S3